MPVMDEIENTQTGQTLVVYSVDADEYLASGDWQRRRSDLAVQPSVRQRSGGVLGQSELRRVPPPAAERSEGGSRESLPPDPALPKGTRK